MILSINTGSRDCGCGDWHGCIMRPSVIGEEGIQPYKFSTCSRKQFNGYLGDGRLLCLLNNPNEPSYPSGGNVDCGNGIIDPGEDCDCGGIQQCKNLNSCCDPYTCRLKTEAECSEGECCDESTCKVIIPTLTVYTKLTITYCSGKIQIVLSTLFNLNCL